MILNKIGAIGQQQSSSVEIMSVVKRKSSTLGKTYISSSPCYKLNWKRCTFLCNGHIGVWDFNHMIRYDVFSFLKPIRTSEVKDLSLCVWKWRGKQVRKGHTLIHFLSASHQKCISHLERNLCQHSIKSRLTIGSNKGKGVSKIISIANFPN